MNRHPKWQGFPLTREPKTTWRDIAFDVVLLILFIASMAFIINVAVAAGF